MKSSDQEYLGNSLPEKGIHTGIGIGGGYTDRHAVATASTDTNLVMHMITQTYTGHSKHVKKLATSIKGLLRGQKGGEGGRDMKRANLHVYLSIF